MLRLRADDGAISLGDYFALGEMITLRWARPPGAMPRRREYDICASPLIREYAIPLCYICSSRFDGEARPPSTLRR